MNSYLARLIERATNTKLDLENNQIGNYRITPQHGNVFVYHIYKNGSKMLGKFKRKYNNEHVATITIGFNNVIAELNKDYLSTKEIESIKNCLTSIYIRFNITIETENNC